jgi:hypothetical protein
MIKFAGNLIVSLVLVAITSMVLRSLPDLARYIKLREM